MKSKANHEAEFSVETPFRPQPKRLAVSLMLCCGGWLLPGLAHLLLGKWIRAMLFAASILALFVAGVAMEGRLYDLTFDQPLQIVMFFANAGVGIPYWIVESLGWATGKLSATTFDYGTTYLWVAGLLNYLTILDAFDIAQGRKR